MASDSRYALVTGSSRGIGRAIALRLADEGCTVAIHYLKRQDAAEQVLAEVRERGANGFIVPGDMTQTDDIRHMIGRVRAEFGALDILVSNARPEFAEFYRSPLEMTSRSWDVAMDSQARAFLVTVQTSADLLRDGSRIIVTSYSPSTRYGSWQPWAAMGAAKAAMETLVRYFAVALAPRGITVNCVSPGFVLGQADTLDATVINSLPDEAQQAIQEWHEGGWTPMRRLATPADVSGAVSLLCGPEASFITGQTLHVDGGASLMDAFSPLHLQGIGRT